MAASIGSPSAIHLPSWSTARPTEAASAAVLRCRASPAPGPVTSASGPYPAPMTLSTPAGVQTSTAFIRFWVNVPVLSVQMKVVEPRVSTASRFRTSALRWAIRCAPTARDSVTVGSRPSGTSATITPMANKKASRQEIPTSRDSTKNSTPMPRAIAAVMRTIRCSSRASGLGGASTLPVRAAISASRVFPPVPATTPSAWPLTRKVPPKTVSPGTLASASLSPVSIDSSTEQPAATASRRSAGTRSPATSTTASSGTSSVVWTLMTRLSRRTETMAGSSSRSLEAACWARSCWM